MVLAGLVSVLAAPAFSQSLAEAAKKERERRKTQPEAKVYTEGDLRRAGQGSVSVSGQYSEPAQPAASPSPATPGSESQKSEDEVRNEQEQAWRDKLQQANQDVQRYQEQVTNLQQAANDLTGNLYGSGRTKLLNELEQARKNLAEAQQRVAQLQEEGRRSRFRP